MSPDTVALLGALQDAAERATTADREGDLLKAERDALIRQAAADGATHAQIARASGLTRGRIGQITAGQKPARRVPDIRTVTDP